MPQDAGPSAILATPDPAVLRLRAVHRAVAELRRGTPIVLDGPQPLVVLAAETAGAGGLAEMATLAAAPPCLLLSPIRAAALLRRPLEGGVVALRSGGLLDPDLIRGMADPTADQLLTDPPELVALPTLAPAAIALVKLARLMPAALVAPPLFDTMRSAAEPLGLLTVAADDVLAYPESASSSLQRVAEAHVPLAVAADSRVVAFRPADGGIEHLAIVIGDPAATEAPLVRLHSECFTGDLLGSLRCDCGPQLQAALRRIAEEGAGVLLYLAQEGRGIGLPSKLRAYVLQDQGLDTVDANRALGWQADERRFLVAAAMLDRLGLAQVRLLTNNPDKVAALTACGIQVTERVALQIDPNGVNDYYLETKARRLGHLL